MLFIKFLSVGCADGIHIRYYGIDAKWHNVLIDGGRNSTYHSKFKPILEEIANNEEFIDAWIISHIDDDYSLNCNNRELKSVTQGNTPTNQIKLVKKIDIGAISTDICIKVSISAYWHQYVPIRTFTYY